MTASKRSNAGRTTSKAKLKALEDENAELRDTVEKLRQVNSQQVQRLVEQELLKLRIAELEKQVNGKADG